jgi:hypothetical protein
MFARIAHSELQLTLHTMASLVGRASGDAGWTFQDGTLTLAWAGGSRTFVGVGAGTGTVQVRGADMVGIAAVLDDSSGVDADVEVRAEDKRLFLGGFSVEGLLLPSASGTVPQLLPVDASLRDVLRLPFLYEADVIAAAGLAAASAGAKAERAKLVQEALSILAPVGMTAQALDACVDACLADQATIKA